MNPSSLPTKIEVFLGDSCDRSELWQSFAADARRLLGQPYETHATDDEGWPVIIRPVPDPATVEDLHRQLLAAGYDVEVGARSYRIEQQELVA